MNDTRENKPRRTGAPYQVQVALGLLLAFFGLVVTFGVAQDAGVEERLGWLVPIAIVAAPLLVWVDWLIAKRVVERKVSNSGVLLLGGAGIAATYALDDDGLVFVLAVSITAGLAWSVAAARRWKLERRTNQGEGRS